MTQSVCSGQQSEERQPCVDEQRSAPEDTVAIFEGSGAPLREVSTGHTLFLEEWELEPGDLVAQLAVGDLAVAGDERHPIVDVTLDRLCQIHVAPPAGQRTEGRPRRRWTECVDGQSLINDTTPATRIAAFPPSTSRR